MGKYLLSAATNALTLLSSPTQPQWLIWFQVLQLKTRIRIYIYKFNAHELKMATLLCSPAVMLEVEGATFELQCVPQRGHKQIQIWTSRRNEAKDSRA